MENTELPQPELPGVMRVTPAGVTLVVVGEPTLKCEYKLLKIYMKKYFKCVEFLAAYNAMNGKVDTVKIISEQLFYFGFRFLS